MNRPLGIPRGKGNVARRFVGVPLLSSSAHGGFGEVRAVCVLLKSSGAQQQDDSRHPLIEA